MLAAAEDVSDESSLLVGHLPHQPVPEHLGEADDGVEGRPQLVGHVGEELGLHPARSFELDVLPLQRLFEAFQLRHVTRRREDALQSAVAIVKCGRVVRHHRERAVSSPRRELVVGEFALVQHAVDARLGAPGIGEVVLERRSDEFVARTPGQRLGLFVDVGDDAARIGGH